MMKGYKTYTGIAVTLLGAFGIFSYVSESDLTTTLNTIMTIIGAGLASYGRYKAKPK